MTRWFFFINVARSSVRNMITVKYGGYNRSSGAVSVLMVPLMGYCTISDYNKQNSAAILPMTALDYW